MKSVSKNTTYVPNRDVKELMLILKGELKKISGSDIIDGVYVKNKKTTSKMPQSSVSEILEKLKSIQKENEAELGIGETEIKELLNAGFNAKDIEIIYSGYSPSSVNADTEFGNTTSGFVSSYADYQKRGVKSIVESASQGMYEIGLKYPDFNWKSIIDKYKIKSTPKIVTKSIRDYEYKYEVYFGNGIAIGHSIAYKSGSEAWQDEGNAIGELTSKPSKFQKDRSYKAGFNGGYWGIVVKSKDAVYSIVDDLLKQSGSYVKDLELFENRLGGIGINEVKNEKFAKGGGVGEINPQLNEKIFKRAEQIYASIKGKNKKDFDESFDKAIIEYGYNPAKYHSVMRDIGARYDDDIEDYAKGGGVGKKRSLMSMANLVDWKGEGIKKWYMRSYPTDELGEELNDDVTFKDLWDALNNKQDVYELMGVADSVVRERLFQYLSLVYDVDYDVVYKKWLNIDDYANGGGVGSQFEYTIGGL